jgi:hypothetical protein
MVHGFQLKCDGLPFIFIFILLIINSLDYIEMK